MVKKYTIKELLDSVDEPVEVYKRFANEFTKDDIMYALSKDMDTINLIKYVKDKFDPETIKYYIKKNIKINDNNNEFFKFLVKNFKDKFDKELIGLAFEYGVSSDIIFKDLKDKFNKEDIKYIIEKIRYIDHLEDLCEYFKKEIDKDFIKIIIDKGVKLKMFFENIYRALNNKFDKELIKYAIDAIKKDRTAMGDYDFFEQHIDELYSYLGDKFDNELMKYLIDSFKNYGDLGYIYSRFEDKFDKELIKYAIDKKASLFDLYLENKDKFDKELIKYAIDKEADLKSLYEYLGNKFDDELKQLYNKKRYHKK